MSIRTVVFSAAVLCALPLSGAAAQQVSGAAAQQVSGAAAQQASDPVTVPVPALTETANVPANPQPARTSLMLQRPEQLPAYRLTPAPALAAPAAEGQHVFVISTLALVLGVILLVVLID